MILIVSFCMLFWMVIVHSHLREQTKYLKKIAEKI